MIEFLGSLLFEQVAKFFRVAPSDLTERVREWDQRKRTEAELERLRTVNAKKAALSAHGLANKLVIDYYMTQANEPGVGLLVFQGQGWRSETTQLSTNEWMALNHDVRSEPVCTLSREAKRPQAVELDEGLVTIEGLLRNGLRIWNAPIFSLDQLPSFDRAQRPTFPFSLDEFFNYRLGIGRLNDEIYHALIDVESDGELDSLPFSPEQGASLVRRVLDSPDRHLPLRSRYLPDVRSVLAVGERANAGGVAVLLACKNSCGTYDLYLHRRGGGVSENQFTLGVLPHGFHQPLTRESAEVALKSTVLRELYEELFGGEEQVDRNRKKWLAHDFFLNECRAVRWLENNSAYDLRLTGFGLNLASGNFDLSLLLRVPEPEFLSKFRTDMRGCWEFQDEMVGRTVFGSVVEVVKSNDESRIEELLRDRHWTGSALMAFARGLTSLAAIDAPAIYLPDIRAGISTGGTV